MKIKAVKPFCGPEGFVEVGQEVEMSENLGKDICAKGYAVEVLEIKEEPKQDAAKPRAGPIFQHRVSVSKTRNLTVEVWPPRENSEFSAPSVSLAEGRLENGEWKNARIYLGWGALLELAEALREAWRKVYMP